MSLIEIIQVLKGQSRKEIIEEEIELITLKMKRDKLKDDYKESLKKTKKR